MERREVSRGTGRGKNNVVLGLGVSTDRIYQMVMD